MSLQKIQSELKAPKGQRNTFGNYNYRSCEDILEAVKPILKKHGATLTISDEIIEVCQRVYVKATATLFIDDKAVFSTTACAREAESKKGMDSAQITGAASSYARKYALNGLFAIDDTKDADATNEHGVKKESPSEKYFFVFQERIDSCKSSDDIDIWCDKNWSKVKKALNEEDMKKAKAYVQQSKDKFGG